MSKSGIFIKVFYFLNRVLGGVKALALTCHFMPFSYTKANYVKIYIIFAKYTQIYIVFSFLVFSHKTHEK